MFVNRVITDNEVYDESQLAHNAIPIIPRWQVTDGQRGQAGKQREGERRKKDMRETKNNKQTHLHTSDLLKLKRAAFSLYLLSEAKHSDVFNCSLFL